MLVETLKHRLLSLPTPSPNGFWKNIRETLRGHMASDEPVEEFLNWPEVASTMFVGNAPYTRDELEALVASPEWIRYQPALAEDKLGKPPTFDVWTSGNLIHQCYHLMQWESETGLHVEDLTHIVEIGAGYGALCKIIRRLGFTGEYLIYDLPEFALLQEWYLGTLGLSATWASELPERIITPDLLIALWSLSEMKAEVQSQYSQAISPAHYLVSTLDALWEGEDNKALFKGLSHFLTRRDITHLPGSYYLIG